MAQDNRQKTFLLGVGAQKSGTSWLFHYLQSHPQVKTGLTKEYHVFDRLHLTHAELGVEVGALRRLANRLGFGRPAGIRPFLKDPRRYFAHFDALLHDDDKAILTGDITPSYAGLPPEAFEFIRRGLDERGFRIRVVFLMRDPVDRCISAARMRLRKMGNGKPWRAETENAYIAAHYATRAFEIRTRYDMTIPRLESVFAADELFYGFYESFFDTSKIASLCDFLGLDYHTPDLALKVNVSRTDNLTAPSLIHAMQTFYRPVYDFADARFGADELRKLWLHHPANAPRA